MSEDFDAFWSVYPRREGANPKSPARTRFERAVSKGAKADDIIRAAKAYASDPSTKQGTPYVAQAVTWLNQRRWEDYLENPAPTARAPEKPTHGLPWGNGIWLQQDTDEWIAWRLFSGSAPTDRYGGWTFPSRWPPDLEQASNTTDLSGNGLFPIDVTPV